MSKHWATMYLGEPWVAHDNDCWSFFCRVQKEKFGRNVPVINADPSNISECVRTFSKHSENANWQETQLPLEGDGVLMSLNRFPTHVGLWVEVDGIGGVLHCVQHSGVIFSRAANLLLLGFNITGFYRHKDTL